LFSLASTDTFAADNVAGNLINFNNDGMWSWFMDERAIIDPTNGTLLIGSNSSSPIRYPVGRPTGSVDVFSYDIVSGSRSRFQLSDIDEDDHNAPGLIILPNGKYLAMYSNHGNTGMGDYLSRYRISTNPHDSTAWTAEQSFNWQSVTGWNTSPNANNRVSYHNLYYLPEDDGGQGRIYNFSRGTHQSANSLIFNETTNTWSWGGQLTESSTGGYSTGYVKYASNDADRIYFISTETHPRNYNNNVYAGYVSDGKSYDMTGNLIDANMFDNDNTGGAGAVPDISQFTRIFQSDSVPGAPLYSHAWTSDLAVGPDGHPYGLFTARWKDDDPLGNGSPYGDNEKDNNGFYHHTLFYARFDGANWHVNPVAKMGQLLHLSEEDYTGLGSINPNDPNTIYVSTPLDPRTAVDPPLTPGGASPSPSPTDFFWNPTYQVLDGVHEIYKGVTADGGQTWSWTPITQNSTADNLRPLVPAWDADHTAVVWFKGPYIRAFDADTAVVGIIEQNDTETGLVHYVDATTSNTTRSNGSDLAATGPSSAEGSADSNWHWRTGTGNGDDVLASGGSGSENAPTIRTTLSGLDDGQYDIFAYFWANPSQDWRVQAGFDLNNLQLIRDNGAQQAEASQFDPLDPTVDLTGASSSALYRFFVGRTDVTGGSEINVFLDDFSANTSTRTWYDGLGYALVTDVIQGLAGDFNGDLVVNAADYTVWRNNLGTDFDLYGNGDESGDSENVVDQADYELWKDNFGNTLPGSGSGAIANVPEPSTALLFWLSALAIPVRSRRSRNEIATTCWCGTSPGPSLSEKLSP
jgi:hypothetical protein